MQKITFIDQPAIDAAKQQWNLNAQVEHWSVCFYIPITPQNNLLEITTCVVYEWQELAMLYLERRTVSADQDVDLTTFRPSVR